MYRIIPIVLLPNQVPTKNAICSHHHHQFPPPLQPTAFQTLSPSRIVPNIDTRPRENQPLNNLSLSLRDPASSFFPPDRPNLPRARTAHAHAQRTAEATLIIDPSFFSSRLSSLLVLLSAKSFFLVPLFAAKSFTLFVQSLLRSCLWVGWPQLLVKLRGRLSLLEIATRPLWSLPTPNNYKSSLGHQASARVRHLQLATLCRARPLTHVTSPHQIELLLLNNPRRRLGSNLPPSGSRPII